MTKYDVHIFGMYSLTFNAIDKFIKFEGSPFENLKKSDKKNIIAHIETGTQNLKERVEKAAKDVEAKIEVAKSTIYYYDSKEVPYARINITIRVEFKQGDKRALNKIKNAIGEDNLMFAIHTQEEIDTSGNKTCRRVIDGELIDPVRMSYNTYPFKMPL